ncbi:transporter substrate-binding domain-containing protein, partial [Kingella kingae]
MLAKSKVLFSSTILSMCLLAACSGGNNAPAASQNTDAASSAAPAASLDLNKTYIVATDATYAPMEYMENEKVVGFSHDVLDAAAKSQNVKLEFVNT